MRFPFLLRRLAALMLLLTVAFVPGCRKKSPEDRLEEAQRLIAERQVPMAMIRLKDLVADAPDAEAAIGARFLLAQLYAEYRNEEYYRRALEEVKAIYEKLGMNDSRSFEAYAFATDLLLSLGQEDEALAHLEAGRDKTSDAEIRQRLDLMSAGLRLTFEQPEIRQPGIDRFLEVMLTDEDQGMRGQAREILARFYADSDQLAEANAVYQQYIDKFADETIVAQLQIAQSLNYQKMGDDETAAQLFDNGAGQMMSQVEEELNLEKRASLLNDLAMYYAAFGDIETGIELLRRIMAENVRTLTAIQAQTRIGEFLARDPANYDRAVEHFEQMARENPGNEIGQRAETAVQNIRNRQAELAREAEAVAAPAAAPEPAPEAAEPEP